MTSLNNFNIIRIEYVALQQVARTSNMLRATSNMLPATSCLLPASSNMLRATSAQHIALV